MRMIDQHNTTHTNTMHCTHSMWVRSCGWLLFTALCPVINTVLVLVSSSRFLRMSLIELSHLQLPLMYRSVVIRLPIVSDNISYQKNTILPLCYMVTFFSSSLSNVHPFATLLNTCWQQQTQADREHVNKHLFGVGYAYRYLFPGSVPDISLL